MDARSLCSTILGNERRVWLQPAADNSPPAALCLFLDGEYYVERMDAPTLIDQLAAADDIPAVAVVYVSHLDAATRWPESFCNPCFARFIDEELIPWAIDACGANEPRPVILGGLSLTGLAAAHAALHSKKVRGVICQSASFWWSNGWLVKEVRRRAAPQAKFRITCGTRETTDYVEHGPDLIQRTSQLDSNRTMRDALAARGCEVSYEELEGGHDIASWRQDLSRSLSEVIRLISGR